MDVLTTRTKFFTCVGDKDFKPGYEKTNLVSECTLKLTNKTKKVVLQFQERFADKKMFEHSLKDSYLPFDGWLKETDLAKDMCFTSRPFLKEIGEQRWFEMVATIRETSLVKFLQASGHGGIFVNTFLEKGDTNEFSIVWLEDDISLKEALSRASRHNTTSRGVVANKRGLGIRVLKSDFMDMVGKFVNPMNAAKEIRRQGQKIYEVSRAPPWLDVDELVMTLRTQWSWDVDYLRTIKNWNTKTVLLKSSEAPKRDTIILEHHRMTVQLAKEKEPTRPSSRLITNDKIPNATPPRPSQPPETFTAKTKVENDNSGVLSTILQRLDDLADRMGRMENKRKKVKKKSCMAIEALSEASASKHTILSDSSITSEDEEKEKEKKRARAAGK